MAGTIICGYEGEVDLAETIKWELEFTQEVPDVTPMNTTGGYKQFATCGLKGVNGSFTSLVTRVPVGVHSATFKVKGAVVATGSIIVTSSKIGMEVAGVATYDCTFVFNGQPTA